MLVMGEDHEDYSSFLFNLSQQLSVEECGDLAFLAGLAKQTVALCPGHLHCVCTGHGVDATMPCSPTLAQLRRLEKAEVFNQGDLTKLAEILDRIGRKDLATRCTDAGWWLELDFKERLSLIHTSLIITFVGGVNRKLLTQRISGPVSSISCCNSATRVQGLRQYPIDYAG